MTMQRLRTIFASFFKIGLFTFGGGYAMLPLIEQELIAKRGWIEHKEFLDLLTLAQSVPGPIAINTSVFVGYKMRGLKGAVAALLGSVLPGVTRRSCIQLLKDWGYEVEERQLAAEEIFTALAEGRLQEAWGCGTAAVVSPIGELSFHDKAYTINDFKIGPVTQRLYDELTGIQYGRLPDTHGWTRVL